MKLFLVNWVKGVPEPFHYRGGYFVFLSPPSIHPHTQMLCNLGETVSSSLELLKLLQDGELP